MSDELIKNITDDHYFDAFSSRMCHGHALPCNTTGICVSDDDAAKVFALGDHEYKYDSKFLDSVFMN